MAIQQKHGDRQGRMDFDNDFTTEQSQRFSAVANTAIKRRVKKREIEAPFIQSAKQAAFKTVVRPRGNNPNRTRQVVWIIVIGLVSLWLMYMAG
ncbi:MULTISPECIES: hypothetical protein [Vibrio]|uniref:Uncharacterized protein n=1 Tax=Vibrio echinoideorum TaxID=2100116 RepID=A0ABU9FMN3_9VIBR|nr:hypothetical protein [Vibrio sp. L3-7]MCF7505992.1 hypothetical protein [Vibrio sp. L3-7]OED72325.1 hypothetical protein A143_16910 [Vibrio splendidus ZS-139]TVU65144.1 hypothetical protein FQP88_03525 [Vibrio atlanticus]